MTIIPDYSARFTETTRLLVLDPSIGPTERALAKIALGDEVLVVSGGRICFRRVMASHEALPPVQITNIPAAALGHETPRHSVLLDSRQLVAAAALPLSSAAAAGYGTDAAPEAGAYWLEIVVEGADCIVAENLAVTTGLPEEANLPLGGQAPIPSVDPTADHTVGARMLEIAGAPPIVPPKGSTIAFKPVITVPDIAVEKGAAPQPDASPVTAPFPSAPMRASPQVSEPDVSVQPSGHENRTLAIRAFNGPLEVALIGVISEGPLDIYRFTLPPRTTTLRLSSPSAAPEGDGRRLGIAICRLVVESTDIPLESPALVRGFHRAESGEGLTWRWTDGEALLLLPPKPVNQTLSVHITSWHLMLQTSAND